MEMAADGREKRFRVEGKGNGGRWERKKVLGRRGRKGNNGGVKRKGNGNGGGWERKSFWVGGKGNGGR